MEKAILFKSAILASVVLHGSVMAGDPTPSPIRVELVADGLSRPVAAAFPPGDDEHAMIVGKRGDVVVVDLEDGTVRATPFLDLIGDVIFIGERGLLDLVFDPEYQSNGFFYVAYNAEPDNVLTIARYTVSADPLVADANSQVIIKTIPHEISGHNGGSLQFGPVDGYLYFFSGDGSTAALADEDDNAQNPDLLLGKIIRLDVDAAPDYIPASNPFVGDPSTRDEIWAFGLRNPWRSRFDRVTGDLYIADVGWEDREEINFQPFESPGGENYGWRCQEGELCTEFVKACVCLDASLVQPLHTLSHDAPDDYCAVVGGYVYRGIRLPELNGRYLYANYCEPNIRSLVVQPDGGDGYIAVDDTDHTLEFDPDGLLATIVSFGADHRGELYITSFQNSSSDGALWKIVAACPADISRDGVVGVDDMLLALGSFGPCDPCIADIDDDGNVDVDDLLTILAAWGDCE